MVKTIHIIDTLFFKNYRDACCCMIDSISEKGFCMIEKQEDNQFRVDIYEEILH